MNMAKIVKITYKTSKNNERMGLFLKTIRGYQPIFIEEGYLDNSQEIIKEEEVFK